MGAARKGLTFIATQIIRRARCDVYIAHTRPCAQGPLSILIQRRPDKRKGADAFKHGALPAFAGRDKPRQLRLRFHGKKNGLGISGDGIAFLFYGCYSHARPLDCLYQFSKAGQGGFISISAKAGNALGHSAMVCRQRNGHSGDFH